MPRLCFAATLLVLAYSPCGLSAQEHSVPAGNRSATAATPQWEKKLLRQFEQRLQNSLTDSDTGCIDCHSDEGTSTLVFTGRPLDDFRMLLDGGYLREAGPDTLLGRVTSQNIDRRMPKHAAPWQEEQVRSLRRLVRAVQKQQKSTGLRTDEQFPRSLLTPFEGTVSTTPDNQFLSFRQLRGKIHTIFEDDWIRGNRDLFAENVAMFGGADFETRFHESTEPSASYLTGLEMLARDVADRASRRLSGPFEDCPLPVQAHHDASAWTRADVDSALVQLYKRILFRAPTDSERDSAVELLTKIGALENEIAVRDSRLAFELVAQDLESGLQESRTLEIPVRGDSLQVKQIVVDQSDAPERMAPILDRFFSPLVDQCVTYLLGEEKNSPLRRVQLSPKVHLEQDNENQRVAIYNHATHRNVSFAGIEIHTLNGELVDRINADDPSVQVDGAWELDKKQAIVSFEDGNRHKGLSSIIVPLQVGQEGDYQISLLWRAGPKNSSHTLVELFAPTAGNRLSVPNPPVRPATGETHVAYDCSNDTVAFFELAGTFQFEEGDYVEISNRGTSERVTAGAVEFLPEGVLEKSFLIDSVDAEGSDAWERFDAGRFRAYNVKGQKLHDNNRDKGKLSLRYVPSSHPASEDQNGWQAGTSYRVRIYYPGKRDQEIRVPVKVVARRSSPILQLAAPVFAKSDTLVRLNASTSYTHQASPLEFHWRQVAGPRIELTDPNSPVLEFTAPRLSAQQVGWASLCAALLRHPDFVFTRPPSIDTASKTDRRRLQLVKLALDLLGRVPTEAEWEKLEAGQTYDVFVDDYLDSAEFRDYYFHRIRLYLESQGTDVQDEPVRLWSYVAFNDRPFQEILTADYTVDENFQRVERPAHHGKTGLLTSKGFIQGKPGLPHYNYAAQVSMLFLGYVFEVPPEIVDQREGVTALGTTDPNSVCYSCHKILTPLAFQRLQWTDDGAYRTQDDSGQEIDASDRGSVDEYPFPGNGLEAFATQAVRKERFVRSIINTHFHFYFGRTLRHREEERGLYRRLWDNVHQNDFKIRALIRAIVTSEEYLGMQGSPLTRQASRG